MFSIATSTMIVIAILITKITLHVSIPVLYVLLFMFTDNYDCYYGHY